MRTIAELAAKLGISERQFHRRLNAGDGPARLALKVAVLAHGAADMECQTISNGLIFLADEVRRCDPDFSEYLYEAAGRIRAWREDPACDGGIRWELDQAMQSLLKDEDGGESAVEPEA